MMDFDPCYVPASGRTVRTVVGSSLAGSGDQEEVRKLPDWWKAGLLRSRHQRLMADQLVRNATRGDETLWYRIVLDERWTMRRAAEVLREAGCSVGELCAWTNRWARPPAGTPPAGSGPAETPADIARRCECQLADGGAWPLTRTEEIGRAREWQPVG